MGIKLLGYSERGLLNSLFYELSARDKSIELLGRLLNQAYFSGGGHAFKISEAQIFIEPSLSDFGDADTVLLIKNSGRKQTVFIEAKVKTFEKKEWLIKNEFEKFRAGVEDKKVSVSNLFAQLYQKQELVRGITDLGIQAMRLQGIDFPKSLAKKGPRRIGNNKVVINVVNLINEYKEDYFFIGLIPDSAINIKNFADGEFQRYQPNDDPRWHWSTHNLGWLAWDDACKFCLDHKFNSTLDCFKHNAGQVY